MNNKIQGESLQHKVRKEIPLVITYSAGVPSISQNPENEDVSLTDVGVGDLTITLANASLAPVIVKSLVVQATDANVLGLIANLDAAPTTTVVRVVVNSGADGATETDPVAIHVVLEKLVVA